MNTPSSTEVVPVLAAQATSSVFHKAANVAIWSLVGSFGVNFFLGSMARDASRNGTPSVFFIVNGLIALLQLTAIVCGVIALCGIRKYGKKGLLWKGLIGALVPVLLVLAAIPAFNAVRKKSLERAQQQHETSP